MNRDCVGSWAEAVPQWTSSKHSIKQLTLGNEQAIPFITMSLLDFIHSCGIPESPGGIVKLMYSNAIIGHTTRLPADGFDSIDAYAAEANL
jgi:hypothetical protein